MNFSFISYSEKRKANLDNLKYINEDINTVIMSILICCK